MLAAPRERPHAGETAMLNLTTLGIFHTALGILAVIIGAIALVRDKAIDPTQRVGQAYIALTLVTVLTGFGIFQHGGFGKPHALGVLTLIVFAIAALARRSTVFGRASAYVETVSYSTTFFFHFVPGITETFTRVPVGSPLADHPEAPIVLRTVGTIFVIFLIGATLQVRRMRLARGAAPTTMPPAALQP
jgi:uncharacterized membrane protein